MKPAEFKALLERCVAEERANPTPIEELEAFEKEASFKLRGDFKDSLMALYVAAQPTKAQTKRGAVD